MGRFYDIIQKHIDEQAPYAPTPAQVARRLGVTRTTLTNWQHPRTLVSKEHLRAVAALTGVPYVRVLDALLEDIGYLRADDGPDTPSRGSRRAV